MYKYNLIDLSYVKIKFEQIYHKYFCLNFLHQELFLKII